MLRGIVAFFAVWFIIHFGIQFFRQLTLKEKLSTVTQLAYSVGVAIITMCLLTLMVVLF